jgi:hypothetical protein
MNKKQTRAIFGWWSKAGSRNSSELPANPDGHVDLDHM